MYISPTWAINKDTQDNIIVTINMLYIPYQKCFNRKYSVFKTHFPTPIIRQGSRPRLHYYYNTIKHTWKTTFIYEKYNLFMHTIGMQCYVESRNINQVIQAYKIVPFYSVSGYKSLQQNDNYSIVNMNGSPYCLLSKGWSSHIYYLQGNLGWAS